MLDVVAGLVDQAVPADAACWSTFDPATMMITSSIGRDLDESRDAEVRFFELEYALDTPGQYRTLASDGTATAVIDATDDVDDDRTASALYEHLDALGVRQQLRVVLHDQGAAWGGSGLMRASGFGCVHRRRAAIPHADRATDRVRHPGRARAQQHPN